MTGPVHLTGDQFNDLFSPRRRLTVGTRVLLVAGLVVYALFNGATFALGLPPSWAIVPASWCAVLAVELLYDDHRARKVPLDSITGKARP